MKSEGGERMVVDRPKATYLSSVIILFYFYFVCDRFHEHISKSDIICLYWFVEGGIHCMRS